MIAGLPGCLGVGCDAGHNDGREPEAGVPTVGRLDVVTALVPVLLGNRLAHVSLDTLGSGQIVHASS